eukprot:2255419-Prymnesium_polylepis.2
MQPRTSRRALTVLGRLLEIVRRSGGEEGPGGKVARAAAPRPGRAHGERERAELDRREDLWRREAASSRGAKRAKRACASAKRPKRACVSASATRRTRKEVARIEYLTFTG